MYIPKLFKVTDINEIKGFIKANSFGTLITTKKGRPIATHLPLELQEKGEEVYITGHLAYGNPQWRTLETCEECLIIYQGPHAYVSSSWYEKENVPTWNYQAVHVYGTGMLLSEEELKQELSHMLQKYEKHRENPVLWDRLSPELLNKELKGIVGFKIKASEFQAAYKLSQNRNDRDYDHIINKLTMEDDPLAKQMAEVMKRKKES
ncbi:FMN-binding negative transcriptional regulator [Shimazuella kribbensis]|uniref:FMN-binding negative transcriptional regulator n=1 Tax=Shimazuella kribbensis TaxID=139808 RepID=UPI000414243B|nr:FMN-binding negative transcriptional regulator [Shimazuella kribbensis]